VQHELGDNKFEVTTIYKLIRKLEAEGHTKIAISYTDCERPADRKPGDMQPFRAIVHSMLAYVAVSVSLLFVVVVLPHVVVVAALCFVKHGICITRM
jgi:hypothetical protein